VNTIAAVVNSTTVTLATAAPGTFNNLAMVIGTDDTDALQAACAAARVAGGTIYIPAGGYIFTELPFDLQGKQVNITGEGSANTIFYPAPTYDFASTTTNTGMFWRTNGSCTNVILQGVQVDGATYSFSGGSGFHVLSNNGFETQMLDVIVRGIRGTTAIFHHVGASFNGDHLHFEGGGYIGINWAGAGLLNSCYSGNHALNSLYCSNNDGLANTGIHSKFIGCLFDECQSGAAVLIEGCTDIAFVACRFFSHVDDYAAVVSSSSDARFVACEILPFGTSGNRGGLQVASGSTARLTACRVDGSGTSHGLDNSGTVWDGGANIWADLNGNKPFVGMPLPTSASGLPTGAWWNNSGVINVA